MRLITPLAFSIYQSALSCFFIFILSTISFAQNWEPLNPGAGGQVQDIVCDPNVDGRLFLVSDMEGIYRSTDHGLSWEYTSDDLIHHRTYTVVPDPTNSDRVYAGTLYGMHYSDDGGLRWKLIKSTKGFSIGAIAVDPRNGNNILAAVGWRDDYNFGGGLGTHDIEAPLFIFRSRDGGSSWNTITLENSSATDPNTFQIVYDPSNSNRIYLASAKGLFRSRDGGTSWQKMTAPSNTFSCTGVVPSWDGRHLYATYQLGTNKSSSPAGLFAMETNRQRWFRISGNNGFSDDYLLWYPEVDPTSSANTHRVLMPLLKDRPGLYEAVITWRNGTPEREWRQIWKNELKGYDPGWEYSYPGPRVAHYTPLSWNTKAVWSTINQSMHRGVQNVDGSYEWQNRYSIKNTDISYEEWGDTQYTYRSRGTVSTFTYDIAVMDNYVVQGQADNGLMESWDYGQSWSNVQGRKQFIYDARAVAIANYGDTPTVVAQGGSAFGGNANNGRLFMKRLEKRDPTDEWKLIGADTQNIGGLPNDLILEIGVDDADSERVFVGFDTQGLYVIDNLKRFVEQQGTNARKISPPGMLAVREIAFHPTDRNRIYVTVIRGEEGLYEGVRSTDGNYSWKKLASGRGWNAQVKSWKFQNIHYLLYTAKNRGGIPDYSAGLSVNGGSFQTVFTPQEAIPLRSNKWYGEVSTANDPYTFDINGVAVHENTVILSYYNHKWSKGYGIFRGTIAEDGAVSWRDWTANNHFKGGTDAEIFTVQGVPYYYQGTQGVGLWRRAIGTSDTGEQPGTPAPLSGTYYLENRELGHFLDGDADGTVELSENDGRSKQWEIITNTDGSVSLRNLKHRTWLSALSTESLGLLNNADTSTRWETEKIAENRYRFKNVKLQKYLDGDRTMEAGLSTNPKSDDEWELTPPETASLLAKDEGIGPNDTDALFFPNPVRTELQFANPQAIKSVRFLDMQGKIILEQSEISTDPINISVLPTGTYLLQVERRDGKRFVEKLLVTD